MNLPAIKEEFTVVNTIEEGIEKLCQYGLPHMMKHKDNTWSCTVDMFVASQSASFEIKSGYKNITLKNAIENCLKNMYDCLKQFEK